MLEGGEIPGAEPCPCPTDVATAAPLGTCCCHISARAAGLVLGQSCPSATRICVMGTRDCPFWWHQRWKELGRKREERCWVCKPSFREEGFRVGLGRGNNLQSLSGQLYLHSAHPLLSGRRRLVRSSISALSRAAAQNLPILSNCLELPNFPAPEKTSQQ